MKKFFFAFCLWGMLGVPAQAQWVVHDPGNWLQSITNSINEMTSTAMTAEGVFNNFQQTVQIYQQAKSYYDKLRSVSNLVREARKVQQSVLMVGEIAEVYVQNFDRMQSDKSFSDRELSAIAAGYNRLLEEAGHRLSDLQTIVNPTDLSMTDKDRLDVIDRVYQDIAHYKDLTIYYTRKNIAVAVLRAKKGQDLERVKALYGTDEEKYW